MYTGSDPYFKMIGHFKQTLKMFSSFSSVAIELASLQRLSSKPLEIMHTSSVDIKVKGPLRYVHYSKVNRCSTHVLLRAISQIILDHHVHGNQAHKLRMKQSPSTILRARKCHFNQAA